MLAQERPGHRPLDPPGPRVGHHQRVEVAQREQHVAGAEHRERRRHLVAQRLGVVEVGRVLLPDGRPRPRAGEQQRLPAARVQHVEDRHLLRHRAVRADAPQRVLPVEPVRPGPQPRPGRVRPRAAVPGRDQRLAVRQGSTAWWVSPGTFHSTREQRSTRTVPASPRLRIASPFGSRAVPWMSTSSSASLHPVEHRLAGPDPADRDVPAVQRAALHVDQHRPEAVVVVHGQEGVAGPGGGAVVAGHPAGRARGRQHELGAQAEVLAPVLAPVARRVDRVVDQDVGEQQALADRDAVAEGERQQAGQEQAALEPLPDGPGGPLPRARHAPAEHRGPPRAGPDGRPERCGLAGARSTRPALERPLAGRPGNRPGPARTCPTARWCTAAPAASLRPSPLLLPISRRAWRWM